MEKPTPDKIFEKFRSLQDTYASRNADMLRYEQYFKGDHWSDSSVAQSSSDFRLVFNYCRAIVLKYTSLLARAPRVRINVVGDANIKRAAKNRESFLIGMWPDLMSAWAKVEMNASKKKFGVLQALWQPEPGQPKSVEVGKGGDKATVRKFTKSPFVFRDIDPEHFYAVYRTYTKPDDFLYVIRHDPNRLVEDLKEKYGDALQATDLLEGTEGTCDLLEYWDDQHYILVALTRREVKISGTTKSATETTPIVLKEFKHTYGRAPFFVLQNLVNPGDDPLTNGSLGDLDDVIGLNVHYNLISSEAAEEIITNIHRPTVYKSNDHQQNVNELEFKSGSVYPIGADEDLATLDWVGMPQAVQNHLDQIMGGIQDVSFVGQAGFGQYPSGATGVSLRLLMQSLENILVLKIPIRVACLQAVCELLLRIVEDKTRAVSLSETAPRPKETPLELWMKDRLGRFGQVSLTAEDIAGNYFVDIDYGNILPRAETEYQQNEVYKNKTGNQSLYTTMDNIGVESPDDEMERIREENQDIALNPEKVAAIAQAVLLQIQLQQMQQDKKQPPEGIGTQAAPAPPPGMLPPEMGQPGQPPLGNAPPIPGMPQGGQPAGMPMGGEGLPYMGRGFGPNIAETGMPPGPGMNQGQPRRGLG